MVKRGPLILNCDGGDVLSLDGMDAYGPDTKFIADALSACPGIQTMLLKLQKLCNRKKTCLIKPEETHMKKTNCKGATLLTLRHQCVPQEEMDSVVGGFVLSCLTSFNCLV